MKTNKSSSNFFEKRRNEVSKEVKKLKTNDNLIFDKSKREILSFKFIKKWSRTFHDSMLLEKSLNPFAGEVCLLIPLVNVQIAPTFEIFYDISYDHESKAFKNQFLSDFISVDYQRSVFNKNFIYHLNLRGIKGQIKRTIIEDEFTLDYSDVKISFNPFEQQWIIESPSNRIVYGNYAENGAVKHGLTFKNWSGSGSDVKNLKKVPLKWYIAERHSKLFNETVYYKYEVIEEDFPSSTVQYTSVVQLKKVSTKNRELSVKFKYEVVRSIEKTKNIESMGSLMLNDLMVDDCNIVSVLVETKAYEQVSFYLLLKYFILFYFKFNFFFYEFKRN